MSNKSIEQKTAESLLRVFEEGKFDPDTQGISTIFGRRIITAVEGLLETPGEASGDKAKIVAVLNRNIDRLSTCYSAFRAADEKAKSKANQIIAKTMGTFESKLVKTLAEKERIK